jgi:hypothetical protein
MAAVKWDQAKNEANFAKHGLWFESFEGFDAQPVPLLDVRSNYGEERFRAFGRIDGTPYSIAYTRRGKILRLISFRRAHEKELTRYERQEADRR